jgi:hypothetical protein
MGGAVMNPGTVVELINPSGYHHYSGVVLRTYHYGAAGDEWAEVDWEVKGHPCTSPIQTKHLRVRCLVHGCTNFSDQGEFVGDLCAPCHKILTTGYVGPTSSFLGVMNKRLAELENEVLELHEQQEMMQMELEEARQS